MKFSQLVGRVAGEGADAWHIHYLATAAKERGEDVIILSVGDPDLDTPSVVVGRAIDALQAGDTHYTVVRGRRALREGLARQHFARCGQSLDPEQVIVLAGAQNALMVAMLCLAGPGDEVLTFDPMYSTYPATIESSGATMVRVPLDASRNFRLDVAALRAAITPRSRVICFATPGNPTGMILSAEDLAEISALAEKHDLWIVADEVYAGLAPEGRVPSLARQLPARVVTLGSFSKSHAMCGWRIGWMCGPRELIDHAENLVLCMLYSLPGFIQEAGIAALDVAAEAEQRMRDYCQRRAALMREHLQGIHGLRALDPQAGMFILLDVSATGLDGASFAAGLFHEQRVAVVEGGSFGQQTRNYVRVSFATDEPLIVEACARIRRYCADLASSRSR
ncbi:MAG: pyridoxal phosphate-dependent aminotransferase [Gammaproteobacteria bacterium]|nr:pyridoxal phosphate-dependent aminotransferase [Gammaproteobacteria bacterium]